MYNRMNAIVKVDLFSENRGRKKQNLQNPPLWKGIHAVRSNTVCNEDARRIFSKTISLHPFYLPDAYPTVCREARTRWGDGGLIWIRCD